MGETESKASKLIENIIVFALAFPVVGLLMGGIYSLPVMRICKGREPWLSISLSIGLAITISCLGYITNTPIIYSLCIWCFSIILLLVARRLHGSLDGNLERFGLVHAAAVAITFIVAFLTPNSI